MKSLDGTRMNTDKHGERKLKDIFSRRGRGGRREDSEKNDLQTHAVTFWNFSSPLSPAASSAEGERKAFVFGD